METIELKHIDTLTLTHVKPNNVTEDMYFRNQDSSNQVIMKLYPTVTTGKAGQMVLENNISKIVVREKDLKRIYQAVKNGSTLLVKRKNWDIKVFLSIRAADKVNNISAINSHCLLVVNSNNVSKMFEVRDM